MPITVRKYDAQVRDSVTGTMISAGMLSTGSSNSVSADKIVQTVAAMVADRSLESGMYVQTLGFHSEGDNGDALYRITSEVLTPNNCTIFALSNGTYARRIFIDDSVTLESLNISTIIGEGASSQTLAYNTILQILKDNQIKNVSCGDIVTYRPINIGRFSGANNLEGHWSYNFTFNTITYMGSDTAINIGAAQGIYVQGNKIIAKESPTSKGIAMYCVHQNCSRNVISVREIEAYDCALYINPTYSHGVSGNTYIIGDIKSKNRGIYTYISTKVSGNWHDSTSTVPRNYWYYSWEGEDHFDIGSIAANNNNFEVDDQGRALPLKDGTSGVGVEFYIEPTVNEPPTGNPGDSNRQAQPGDQSITGTITGITFHNLSVENSVIGIYLHCGGTPTAWDEDAQSRAEAGIKSIVINNMRVREAWWTWQFLKAEGYIRDLYIEPTSMIRLCPNRKAKDDQGHYYIVYPPDPSVSHLWEIENQWEMNVTTDEMISEIRGAIFPNDYDYRAKVVGYDLKAMSRNYSSGRRYIQYIARPTSRRMTLSGNVDYGDLLTNYTTTLYMTKYFYVADSVRGSTITLKLPYHYEESAQGIRFRVPKKVGDSAAVVNVSFQDPSDVTQITNTDTESAHLFELSVYYIKGSTWSEDRVLRDLGPVA